MKTKVLIYFAIFVLMASILKADDVQDVQVLQGDFTVTSIALDAQKERLQKEEDGNETTREGGDIEINYNHF